MTAAVLEAEAVGTVPVVDQQTIDAEYWQIIERSYHDREQADRLSDRRAALAEPLGQLIVHGTETRLGRVATGLVLGYAWHTDRRDGILARRSVNLLQKLCEHAPELRALPTVDYLLSEQTRAAGGKRDQEADKIFANRITEALFMRAIHQTDTMAISLLGATALSTEVRDNLMRELRNFGQSHGIDVKAKSLGKIKTALLATGQGLMVLGQTGSIVNRLGLGLIFASNLPSWLAVGQMKHHIRRGLGIKRRSAQAQTPVTQIA